MSFLVRSCVISCGALSIAIGAACGGKVIWVPDGAGGDASTSSSHASSSSKSSSFAASTTGAFSSAVSSTGGGPSCQDLGYNGVGSACGNEGASCVVPFSCCNVSAICTGGVWVATEADCAEACLPCGPSGFGCNVNAVCVTDEFDIQVSYQCAENPCAPGPLDCGCAEKLCQQNFLSCAGTMEPGQLLCDCPTCDGGG
jgi:hypothetical protein